MMQLAKTYVDVQQMIRDGASSEEVEAVLTDERTPLTDDQIASLRAELAERIAKILFSDDMSRADEVPVERDGGRAYDAWRRAAGQAGDQRTAADLAAVDRTAFAAAWEALVRAEVQSVIALVGDDGRRRVVWGIGATEEEAREDAAQWYPDGDTRGLDVETITEAQAETIRRGDVSWPVQS